MLEICRGLGLYVMKEATVVLKEIEGSVFVNCWYLMLLRAL